MKLLLALQLFLIVKYDFFLSKVQVVSKFYQCLYLKKKTGSKVMIAVFQNRDYAGTNLGCYVL